MLKKRLKKRVMSFQGNSGYIHIFLFSFPKKIPFFFLSSSRAPPPLVLPYFVTGILYVIYGYTYIDYLLSLVREGLSGTLQEPFPRVIGDNKNIKKIIKKIKQVNAFFY